MHGFKKRQKRTFRKKADEDDDIEESVDQSEGGSPNPSSTSDAVQKPSGKSKPVENKKKSILSFGDEEEEESEVFQVKKSAESRRLARQVVKEKKKREKSRPEVNTQISAVGEYTAEKLAALKVESFGEQVNDETDLLAVNTSNIPDAATIHAARKRRELARQLGSDIMPLDDTQRMPSRETRSRLVREDDNDISDEEGVDNSKMTFAMVKTSEVMKRKKQSMKDALEDEHSEDEDEELKRWEQEQIKKGVTTQQLSLFQNQEQCFAGVLQMYSQNELGYTGNRLQNVYPYQTGGAVIPTPMPLPAVTEDTVVDISYILTQLRTNLRSLKEVHSQHRMQADRHGEDGRSAGENAGQLESRSSDVAWRYTFYQDMRGYVRDLLACLHEKVKVIDQVEVAYHELLNKRAERIVERRRQDVVDQSSQLDPSKDMAGGVDEFGRDRSSHKGHLRQRRMVDREARSRRRRDKREKNKDKSVKEEHHDGMSTDDEETESAIQWFKGEAGKVMQEASVVFEDVHSEFSSMEVIKEHFEKWKSTHLASYSQAFIGLCLPKLFAPFVRLQMLDWNPVESDGKDFEEMDWFEMLALYGYDAELREVRKDDDVNLLPRVVEKALMPKFLYLLGNVWDPMSRQQSNRVVSLVKKLSDEYPTVSMDSKSMQELLRVVVVKLKETVENDIFLPLYPKSLVENKSTGAFAFVERQFWSCVKLLGNISMWHGLIPDPTLHELCCDSLLNRYLVLSVQHTVCSNSEIMYKCEKAVAALPEQWFEGIVGNKTIKPLETFCWFLGKFAGDVSKASEGGRESDRKEAKVLLQRIALLLARLNAIESAERLVEQYELTPR